MSSSEGRDVRFWPLADIPYVAFDVAFGGKADIHQTCRPKADIARLTHQHAKAIRGQFTPISRRYVQSPKGQVSPLVPPAIPADAPAGVCVLEGNQFTLRPTLRRTAGRKFTQHFLFECGATADSPATHTESIWGRARGKTMPLFPYLPVILWMGMIQVVLGATHAHDAQSVDDPANLTMSRAGVIPFRTPLAQAIVG